MADLIDRQAAIDAITDELMPSTPLSAVIRAKNRLKDLSAVQPDHVADIGKKVEAEDCISRQAAVDALDEQIEQCNKALGSFDISLKDEYAIKVERASLKAYKEQLKNLPSAQPERKKREWIKISPANIYECSECGKNVMTGDISEYDFCHGCGADMRGEQE